VDDTADTVPPQIDPMAEVDETPMFAANEGG